VARRGAEECPTVAPPLTDEEFAALDEDGERVRLRAEGFR
jgi:hypothetical protein